jgi:hypothetical protein
MLLICSFCRFMEVALEPASGEKWCAAFLSLGRERHKEVFHEVGVQDVIKFDSA